MQRVPKDRPVVTIDFETYWASDFSLKSKHLNMSEYVRDERFLIHMMGIKHGAEPTRVLDWEEMQKELAEIDWANTALLCHNTAFDGFILREYFNVLPAYYLDTLSMARGMFTTNYKLDLDSVAGYCGVGGKIQGTLAKTKGLRELDPALWMEVAEYCANDVDRTWDMYNVMVENYPLEELDLIDMTLRMFCDPVLRVDLPRVQQALEAEMGKKVGSIIKAGVKAEDLMSNVKFAALLEARGITVPKKISARTGKPAPAFAKSDQAMLQMRANPLTKDLIEARIAIKSTIGETRAGRMLKVGDDPLPVMLNYCGAHTTRWSGGNKMNLQNLPRGGELRKSVLAPEDYVIVVADSAQIEARVLAWLAKHETLLDLFRTGQDVYKWQAAQVYSKPMESVTKDERFIGKVLTLGLGYGMGGPKLQETLAKGALGAEPLAVSLSVCYDWVGGYRRTNEPIEDLWDDMKQLLFRMQQGADIVYGPLEITKESIILPSGLALQYPDLKITEDDNGRGYSYLTLKGRSRIYGGLLTENVVQALARCVVAEQMLAIGKHFRIVTMSHDEIVVVAPKKRADECLTFMIDTMKTPPKWAPDLPLGAEGGWDVMYSK